MELTIKVTGVLAEAVAFLADHLDEEGFNTEEDKTPEGRVGVWVYGALTSAIGEDLYGSVTGLRENPEAVVEFAEITRRASVGEVSAANVSVERSDSIRG